MLKDKTELPLEKARPSSVWELSVANLVRLIKLSGCFLRSLNTAKDHRNKMLVGRLSEHFHNGFRTHSFDATNLKSNYDLRFRPHSNRNSVGLRIWESTLRPRVLSEPEIASSQLSPKILK